MMRRERVRFQRGEIDGGGNPAGIPRQSMPRDSNAEIMARDRGSERRASVVDRTSYAKVGGSAGGGAQRCLYSYSGSTFYTCCTMVR